MPFLRILSLFLFTHFSVEFSVFVYGPCHGLKKDIRRIFMRRFKCARVCLYVFCSFHFTRYTYRDTDRLTQNAHSQTCLKHSQLFIIYSRIRYIFIRLCKSMEIISSSFNREKVLFEREQHLTKWISIG